MKRRLKFPPWRNMMESSPLLGSRMCVKCTQFGSSCKQTHLSLSWQYCLVLSGLGRPPLPPLPAPTLLRIKTGRAVTCKRPSFLGGGLVTNALEREQAAFI